MAFKETEFFTLKGLDLSFSDPTDAFEYLAESGDDLHSLGVPSSIIDDFYATGDGYPLYDWIVENMEVLYIKEEEK